MSTRRDYLATAGALGVGLLAGCLGSGGDGSSVDVEVVESMPTPVRGDPDADVTVQVFEDYACPHCATYATEVAPRVFEEYATPGTIRYEHHDFPIPVSETWSWAGANAARAVQEQVDVEAFFEYTHDLFANQGAYVGQGDAGYDFLGSTAEEYGADADAVVRAAKGGKYDPVLRAGKQAGRDMGLDGTPEVYVNGSATDGYEYGTVRDAIEAARQS
ncbi:hypothetical protein GCM10009037_28450 [Halarchaeum grantii]|uniref:Thioredoxin-like fold domain-containing protein n=1 Tax=Halarchaeum grantii TaxID=1193105 RepID=A0A830EY29_9EURY|nr:thioredoxin domain-containing protein [Halarchaeum grantii]GGL43281.1 hypothetical protein GCM10009037_28450 [Halarchaeum grantii]